MLKKALSLVLVGGLMVGSVVKAASTASNMATTGIGVQLLTVGGPVLGAGYVAEKLNRDTEHPYWSDFAKIGLGIAACAGLRYHNNALTMKNFISDSLKLSAIGTVFFILNSDVAYKFLSQIPLANGLLTDGPTADSKSLTDDKSKEVERYGVGRFARCILGYMLLRQGLMATGLVID